MKYSSLLLLSTVLVLGACRHTSEILVPDSTKKVTLDPELLKPCEEPDDLKTGTDKDNLNFTIGNLSRLAECSKRHQGLSKVVRSLLDLKD